MDAYLGSVILFAGDYAPIETRICDGSSLQISQNQALFSILGTKHGGDGIKTFNLPNMPEVGGCKYLIFVQGLYPIRD